MPTTGDQWHAVFVNAARMAALCALRAWSDTGACQHCGTAAERADQQFMLDCGRLRVEIWVGVVCAQLAGYGVHPHILRCAELSYTACSSAGIEAMYMVWFLLCGPLEWHCNIHV